MSDGDFEKYCGCRGCLPRSNAFTWLFRLVPAELATSLPHLGSVETAGDIFYLSLGCSQVDLLLSKLVFSA